MTCDATWIFASAQSTSEPFIQIFPVPVKAISATPDYGSSRIVLRGLSRIGGRADDGFSRIVDPGLLSAFQSIHIRSTGSACRPPIRDDPARSEERRVGKECRSRW